MNTKLTDSNTIHARQPVAAIEFRSMGYLLALLCVGFITSIFSSACTAVEFVEIEFKANFRSPNAAGKIPVTKPEFRTPAVAGNLPAADADPFDRVLGNKMLGNEMLENKMLGNMMLENEPLEFRPAGWYADKANSQENEKPEASKWTHKPLAALGTNIALPSGGDFPSGESAPANFDNAYCGCYCNRGWPELCYCFAATGLYYNPLYFEEVNLERYGYGCTPCLQSAVSAAHFFGHVPLLPYMMATDCPSDCIYALGHYRPGNCNPWRRHCLPISKRGGLGQAGAIVGLVFLLP